MSTCHSTCGNYKQETSSGWGVQYPKAPSRNAKDFLADGSTAPSQLFPCGGCEGFQTPGLGALQSKEKTTGAVAVQAVRACLPQTPPVGITGPPAKSQQELRGWRQENKAKDTGVAQVHELRAGLSLICCGLGPTSGPCHHHIDLYAGGPSVSIPSWCHKMLISGGKSTRPFARAYPLISVTSWERGSATGPRDTPSPVHRAGARSSGRPLKRCTERGRRPA